MKNSNFAAELSELPVIGKSFKPKMHINDRIKIKYARKNIQRTGSIRVFHSLKDLVAN